MRKLTVFLTAYILFFSFSCFSQEIKDADLAGPFSWYSNDSRKLRKQISSYLRNVPYQDIDGKIIAMISPHAGVKFSGQVASYGFKTLSEEEIKTVVLVGFSHRADYDEVAVFDYDGYRTPLGVLYTDKDLTEKILASDTGFISRKQTFKKENSIELILPLIQVALGNPKIVILAIGDQSFDNCQLVGGVLAKLLKEREDAVIIASTDMSHFLPHEQAEKIDSRTADIITKMDPEELFVESTGLNRMCGAGAVVSVMIAAKELGADRFIALKSDTSASTAGRKDDVVGYLSGVFIKEDQSSQDGSLTRQQKNELLQIARDTITLYLKEGKIFHPKVTDPKLKEYRGLFVTLRTDGNLRGCMGDLMGDKPLYMGVVERALSALRDDPRFSYNRLSADDLDNVHIEISVLSPLKEVDSADEIIPGKHGVLVKKGFRGGVYLPQVATEMGWDKEEFLNSLCGQKAGLPEDCWKTGKCKMQIFSAEVFEE